MLIIFIHIVVIETNKTIKIDQKPIMAWPNALTEKQGNICSLHHVIFSDLFHDQIDYALWPWFCSNKEEVPAS